MTQATDPRTGQPVYIPGVYTAEEVIDNLPGAVPEFHVPVIAGGAPEGVPFNVNAIKYASELTRSPFVWSGTSTGAKAFWGPDSDIGTAFGYAKRHGLPGAYALCVSKLTRASVLASSAGPIVQTRLYAKKYGAPGGHILLKVAGGATLEITPLKHFLMLSQNLGAAATRVYVAGNPDWVRVGMTLTLGDNDTVNVTKEVTATGYEITATGQLSYWIDIASATGGALATAKYALVCEYDEAAKETSDTFTTGQQIVDWLNDYSEFIGADKQGTFTSALLIALAAATPLKEIGVWSTVTDGASPAPTSSDWDDFIEFMDDEGWDDFGLRYQRFPQAFLAVDDDTAVHASLRDWAIARRLAGFPISVTAGCNWGDIVLGAGNATDPLWRASQLNDDSFCLVAGGIDLLAPYLGHAAAVFGRRIGGGVGHNLTNDVLLYESIEYRWKETLSAELTDLHKAGVMTYRLSTAGGSIRYVLSQGISTIQVNNVAWNVDATTPLLMQRDIVDYANKMAKADLDLAVIGVDTISIAGVAAGLRRVGEKLANKGLLRKTGGFSITSIALNDQGTGYVATWGIRPKETNDFLALTTQIIVGE